ncbi:MAG: hypothetical protein Q9227_003309 [Pyrenula ochraceoflavens]
MATPSVADGPTTTQSRWSSMAPSSPGSTMDDPNMSAEEQVSKPDRKLTKHETDVASSPGKASSPPTSSALYDGPNEEGGRVEGAKNQYLTSIKDETPSRGSSPRSTKRPRRARGAKASLPLLQEGLRDTEDEGSVLNDTQSRASDVDFRASSGAANAVGTRRQANGTIGSVYSGNKMRHLKKEDGAPLWRKDIQYEFLQRVFEDDQPVFTRFADSKPGCTFLDIYVDAMAKSSKTSKILKEKLQTERLAAKNMAMICLLVNVGRMNTTLNFFPEMRAQLRTYHSIPVLQAQQDPSAYKQLQDAPRLKSILKGASEDEDQPKTLEAIQGATIPRTNPVNLIFVLSQQAPRVSELHFHPPRDFFDLVMRPTISSKSRARAFLWLMWWYLEGDFTKEASARNPFGPGTDATGNKDGIPLKVPDFEHLTDEQGNAENVDTPEEVAYGEVKMKERKRILEEDEPTEDKVIKKIKKLATEDISDVDSPPPPNANPESLRIIPSKHSINYDPSTGKLGTETMESEFEPVNPHPGRGRYKRIKKAEKELAEFKANNPGLINSNVAPSTARLPSKHKAETPEVYTPQPPGAAHPILSQYNNQGPTLATENGTPAPQIAPSTNASGRRARPMTQHQRDLEFHRQERVRRILLQKKREEFAQIRANREQENFILRVARRIRSLPSGYDSDDPDNVTGLGGMGPGPGEADEEDWGEECEMWMGVIRRARRRLMRWSGEVDDNPEIAQLGRRQWMMLGAGVNGTMTSDQQQQMLGGIPQAVLPPPAEITGTTPAPTTNRRGGRRGPRTKKAKAAPLETMENGDGGAEADVEVTPATASRTADKLEGEGELGEVEGHLTAEDGSVRGHSVGPDLDDIDKDLLAERSDEGEGEGGSEGDTEMEDAAVEGEGEGEGEGSDVEMGGYDD